MPKNYFQGTEIQPYHISIGGVVRNGEGKICCHYFDSLFLKNSGTLENFLLLMRETIEPNETIEECLARGLMEEFGMNATLTSYLGSIVSRFQTLKGNVTIEKTTIYFLCDLVSQDESLRMKDDDESKSVIQWIEPNELITRMKEQGKRLKREDADESSIIERYLNM